MQTKLVNSRHVALAVALMQWTAVADLPVHCLRHQVAGDWEFTLSQQTPKRSSCGHMRPDSSDHQPPMEFLQSAGPKGTLSVQRFSLKDPNTAVSDAGKTGTWTMIYDEGFEVAVGDYTFFAFSKFEMVDGAQGKTNVSHCDQTEIGWYHNRARSQWGCYSGRKAEHKPAPVAAAPPTSLLATGSGSQSAVPWYAQLSPDDASSASDVSSFFAKSLTVDSATPEVQLHKPIGQESLVEAGHIAPPSHGYDKPMEPLWQKAVEDALNLLQLGWSATSYGMFKGKTPREMNQYAGVRRHRVQPPRAKQQQSSDLSFLSVSSKVNRASAEAMDWRAKGGKNWITPVVEQGDCGSCYTISTVHMLTSRNKIRSGDISAPSFSVSFPLYCAEYNQGCDGGYGFLQTKWSEDVGLVPESCAPFNQGGGSCAVTHGCDLGNKRYRAANHHYVGGFYGGSDADAVRQELVAGGPLVMSFEPQEDFMYYKTGVYRSGPHKIHQEWEQVDHAVLLIGFGQEKGQAYWTLQNSWGTDWGEDGFFRMARGIDESGCESIVVSADVVEEDENPVLADFLKGL